MYNTSTNYKNTILADSTKHVLKLYIGQRQLEPNHIFDFTMNIEMFSDELYLGATPMKSSSFKIHKDEIHSGDTEIRVVSGIEGEEIPMGTFVFEDVKEVDFFTYEITAVDYMYKFEGAYDTDLDFSEGVTLLEVLNDLCEKSDVVLGSESFLNDDTVIAVYDSTLQRKEYLSYIAEQAGGFAIIGRDNKLYIKTFNHTENASELNLNNFKSFKWGQQTSISKIAYEDGIQDFKKGDDSGSTLWIAQKNMYVTSQSQIDNIYDELTETEREIEEEGTSITIEDSKEGTKIDYSIKGETSQNGTPTPSSPVPINNVTGEQIVRVCGKNLFENILTSRTINGLNIAVNTNKMILISGTNSATTTLDLTNIFTLHSGSYIVSTNKGGTISDSCYLIAINTDTNAEIFSLNLRNASEKTLTLSTDTNVKFRIYCSTNRTFTNFRIYPQVEKGTSVTTYEKYQGKDYEINLGKNLLALSTQKLQGLNTSGTWNENTYSYNGIDITLNEDSTITINGTTTSQATFLLENIAHIPYPTGDYYLSGCLDGSSTTYDLRIWNYNGQSSVKQSFTGETLVPVVNNNQNYNFAIVVRNAQTLNNVVIYPMFSKSSSTTYAPYFEPIELNKIGNYQDFIRKGAGKNLFDISLAPSTGIISNGGFKLTKSSNRTITFLLPQYYEAGTYTISFNIANSTLSNLNKFGVWFQDSNGSIQVKEGVISNGKFVVSPEAKFNRLYFFIYNSESDSATITTENVQLEKGSNATSFEPYGYKDKWYIEKNVGKYIINGTETINLISNNRFQIAISPTADDGYSTIIAKCNLFKPITQLEIASTTKENVFAINGAWIYIRKTDISSANDFKTWASTNKPITYYVLANPTYTLIENEELLNQLEELDNATLMEGTTNILVSGDLPFIMNLDFEVRNRNFYQFEGGSIVDPANDLGDVVIIDEKPVIFEGKMSYLGKWYIDVNSTALVKDKAHSMNTKTDTRAKIRRVESQINQIEGEITQVVEATEEISKDYVTNSEYTTYKTEATQSMSGLSRQVSRTVETLYGKNDDGLVKRVKKTETDISQNAEDITLSVGRISSLETKTEELDDNTKKIVKSFKFNDDGLTISNQGSDEDDGANINIDSEDIKIRIGTATKLLINGSGIYYDSASFKKLDLGEFAIVAEENGFLSIIYEGR